MHTTTRQPELFNLQAFPSNRCRVCGRALSDPLSIRLGIGPICRRKQGSAMIDSDWEVNPQLNIPSDSEFVFERNQRGACTNVPWLVKHHSPTGFEWGYGGSGPADLALNILECVLRRMRYKGPKTTMRFGECFDLAWRLHQEFKWHFICHIDPEGGRIAVAQVETWIKVRQAAEKALDGFEDNDDAAQ